LYFTAVRYGQLRLFSGRIPGEDTCERAFETD
jgi:hypothetical protein